VAAANFESFDCPPEAKDGSSALQNAHGFPDHNPAVECDYPTAGSCFYTSDGSLVTQSASPRCPDNLVQDQFEVASSIATAKATSATTSPASLTQSNRPSLPPPTPPSTTFPSTAPSSDAQTSTVGGGGLVTGGVGGSSTSALAASPTVIEGGDKTTITLSKHVQPAVIAGAVVATAVFVFVVLALILIWLRRRRWRNNRGATTHRYLTLDEPPTPPEKDPVPPLPQSESSVNALALESSANVSSESSPSTSSHPNSIGGGSDGAEVPELARVKETNEKLKERLRRVEAQVEALLTHGSPDTAPPEYAV